MNCIVCDSNKAVNLYADLKIKKCECGHCYYDNDLNIEEIKHIYSKEYFSGQEYSNYKADKVVIERNFKKKISKLFKYRKDGKLLEIGSAFGFFLELADQFYNVTGYEISAYAADYACKALNLNVKNSDFLTDNIEQSSFDMVCMYDTIEHLKYPNLYLNKVYDILKDDGYLIISTGDINSILAKIMGKYWRLIHPPSHIHYFSKYSLIQLLNNYNFKVIDIEYIGLWRSFMQLFDEFFKLKELSKFIPGSFYLNTFDIMEITAKKDK